MKATALFLAICVGGLAALPARAQTAYVGLAGGQSHIKLDCTGATSCSNNGTAFKLYGGWYLIPTLAAELTYASLGKASSSTQDAEGSFLGIGLAGRTDFSKEFSAILRGGATSTNGKVTTSAGSFDRNNTLHYYAGLGLGYAVNSQVKVTLDWDMTRLALRGPSGKSTDDVSVISAGVVFGF